mmetsp:Transcript_25378/g.39848  ORF Transcript_25378/g.39848 Transcript_25378/m.39848 type:complete len:146 (-) Transcript_25378:307-744(-)|eukprot:CAMPEP_0201713788 /NCGR_PEP_ID=MMETSP0593-20130828/505_1 /ASSEMBLY_ACC=CAM_ASM_000672 /TAXON_ID=267983 /ORGANISM="Skeletonema japonicum, Strain CCMP2506" /LENGTH=145 /DNA_ID=CAMNT_0048202975 /DNA_START=91 /DNA_END=528 /DNA_ORIENTATION=+
MASEAIATDMAAGKTEDGGFTEEVHLSDEDRDEQEEDDNEEFKAWDEGGKSDCGYRDSLHDTLMAIGASIHKVVGEPSEKVRKAMKGVGNWFQEASYAARDLKRGEMNIAEEIKGSNEEEEEEENERGYEEKLETVAEENSKTGE